MIHTHIMTEDDHVCVRPKFKVCMYQFDIDNTTVMVRNDWWENATNGSAYSTALKNPTNWYHTNCTNKIILPFNTKGDCDIGLFREKSTVYRRPYLYYHCGWKNSNFCSNNILTQFLIFLIELPKRFHRCHIIDLWKLCSAMLIIVPINPKRPTRYFK